MTNKTITASEAGKKGWKAKKKKHGKNIKDVQLRAANMGGRPKKLSTGIP